ncbi:MAG: hypothetical protein KME55_16780 [Nostoc indistinguendum CM1-VF10]|nr:hypothetical protein [Nostoc indistinguendum CM1-VF10]
MQEYWQANPTRLTTQQQAARANPEYARHKRNLVRWRAQLAGRIPMGRQAPEGLRIKIKEALTARKLIPSVLPRRFSTSTRMSYIQHSKKLPKKVELLSGLSKEISVRALTE